VRIASSVCCEARTFDWLPILFSSYSGDSGVGKTALLNQFVGNNFNEKPLPNVFDFYSGVGEATDEKEALRLWDIHGGRLPETTRNAKYSCADVIIICFAIDHVESFENVKNKWYPEAQLLAPGATVVLGGKLWVRFPGLTSLSWS